MNWVLETQFELSFLTLFTGGKKCLKKTPLMEGGGGGGG